MGAPCSPWGWQGPPPSAASVTGVSPGTAPGPGLFPSSFIRLRGDAFGTFGDIFSWAPAAPSGGIAPPGRCSKPQPRPLGKQRSRMENFGGFKRCFGFFLSSFWRLGSAKLRRQSDKPAAPRRGAGGARRSPQQPPPGPPPPAPSPNFAAPWEVGAGRGGSAGDAPVPVLCRRRAGGDAVAVGAAARQS